MRLYDEHEEYQGNPDVDVRPRYRVDDVPVPYPECYFFSRDDGKVIGQDENQGA